METKAPVCGVQAEHNVFEKHSAQQAGLHSFLHLRQEPLGGITEHRNVVEQFDDLVFESAVKRVASQPVEVLGEPHVVTLAQCIDPRLVRRRVAHG